jgi:OOP family OmpA-OmpF porin
MLKATSSWKVVVAGADQRSGAGLYALPQLQTPRLCAANGVWYYLNIVEKGEMKQEVAVNKLLDAINATGRATVYINFDSASARIKPDGKPVIDEILDLLQQSPSLKLSIEGHTDADGRADDNQKLSQERAKAVQAALTAQGVAPARLSAKGFGQSKPVADNKTEDGKARNRRVELVKVS